MASVYRAREESLGRAVALKVMPEPALEDAELVRRFEREARLVARVNHPNVAQVHRIGRIDGAPYYTMELIDGESLAHRLAREGAVEPEVALDWLRQAARGLRAAAEHGIIHRDIKPANLMVTREGVIKIVDFGIAKAVRDETFQTVAGQVLGTPRYMSPEQGQGRPVDHRSDIYSLGATFYHLLAGLPPFEADNPLTLIMMHMKEPVRDLRRLRPQVPERLCNVIYGMLEKLPDRRFADYDALLLAIENAGRPADATMHVEAAATLVSAPIEDRPAGAAGVPWWRAPKKLAMVLGVMLFVLALAALTGGGGADEEDGDPRRVPQIVIEREGGPVNLTRAVGGLRDLHKFQQELERDKKEVVGP